MQYLDFDVEIGPGTGRDYPVSVRSPAGETRTMMRFPFDTLVLDAYLTKLQNALLRSGGLRRQALSPQEQAVQDFGQHLFAALFAGEVGQCYAVSQERARRQEMGVRLRLDIQAPELAALPWEYLYDPDRAEYLCLSRHTPLVRYLELPQPTQPLTIQPPLRILGMLASPRDQATLDEERERERMRRALAELEARQLVQLTWLAGQTWQDLQAALQGGPWHVFHFIGHGGFDRTADEGVLAFANEQGNTHLLHASLLGRLLANHGWVRLAVLNACEGARGSERDLFSSTAALLVRKGIPAVLAMQEEITDLAAIECTRAFYAALAHGLPIDEAVAEARTAISVGIANSLEWGTPVLYLRAPDGVLFALPPAASDPGDTLYGVLKKTKEQWLEEGHAAARAGRLEEALHMYQQAIQADPTDAASHRRTGYLLNQLQRHEEALAALEEAIRLDPNSAHAYGAQGEALSELQRYQEALAAYQHALKLDPALPNAQSGRDRMQRLLAPPSPGERAPGDSSPRVTESPPPGSMPGGDQAAQPPSPKLTNIWTPGFTQVFVLAAMAGGVLTLSGIGGANASAGTDMIGALMGLLADIALVVVCLVGLRFATSALMRVGFAFQLLTAIASIIVWAVLLSYYANPSGGYPYDGFSHPLLATSLLNMVSLVGVSYALMRWQPGDRGLTVLQLIGSIILTVLFWIWFTEGSNFYAGHVSSAEYVVIFASSVFPAVLLVFRVSCWKRQPVVILCLAVANVLWAVFNFVPPISFSLVYALVLTFVGLSALGFLALVQVERVKKASMVG